MKFQDEKFEKSFRDAIKKPEGTINKEDLEKIISIHISPKKVSSVPCPWSSNADWHNMKYPDLFFCPESPEDEDWLKDLALFNNIRTLYLYYPLQDISFLSTFTNLNELYVMELSGGDWTFIEDLLNLKSLYITRSVLTDLSPIANLAIKQQYIFDNDKERPRIKIPLLRNLHIKYCNISDIGPLSRCRHLSDLDLSHNSISDLSPLKESKSLYYLTMRYNNIEDIGPLADLSGLYYLNLRHNKIRDISALSNYKDYYIGRLFLGYNPIEDYSPIKDVSVVYSDVDEYVQQGGFVMGMKVNCGDEEEDEMVGE